ncbi:MraY family glycosyltransferase [Dokdonella sp.]|uniref:MraY family glycosyltransferase n=1 Tax=Dokdonella sp. TaxID=2291710 RepID=UPI0031C1461F|nr:undecaprenyl/decaprenyl-phosphate alpha-N-acetylglucosaminyl 1-phosphate transferase [Dokdonella sp.]
MDFHVALIGAGAAFAATLILQRALAPLAQRLDLLDYPAGRKDHVHPTPVTGGLAMLLGVLFAAGMVLPQVGPGAWAFAVAAGLLIFIGLLDDKYDLSWHVRILAQVVAALMMVYYGGVRIEHLGQLFGTERFALGPMSVPFTVFAAVGAINAVNMIDGMDGLAGTLVFGALAMLGTVALLAGNHLVATHALILGGAVAGFLVFNLHFPWQRRARVFMGNAGSAFLGFAIAWIAFRLVQDASHPVRPALVLWLLPVPLIDCLVLMLRRVRHGRSPFAADRNHIHHLMLEAGYRPMGVVLALLVFSGLCGLAAAAALHSGLSEGLVVAGFFGLCGLWFWQTSRRVRALDLLRALRYLAWPRASRKPTVAGGEVDHV